MQHIRSHSEYIKLLTDLVLKKENRYLDGSSINKFIFDYNLTNDHGIGYNEVNRDSHDIAKRLKSNPFEKKVQNYDQYLRLLNKALSDNGNKRLNQWQVDAFIWRYNLDKSWGINRDDVYTDINNILKESGNKQVQRQVIKTPNKLNEKNGNVHKPVNDGINSKDLTRYSDENLIKIVKEFDYLLTNYKRMKAILMDYYPTEKLKRNLLLACVQENIVSELRKKSRCEKIEIYRYEKRIIEAYGCTQEIAQEMVGLWVSALNIRII